jgi:hypothetical protein
MPAGTTECPHCPPKGGVRTKTIVEGGHPGGTADIGKRKGTIVVGSAELPGNKSPVRSGRKGTIVTQRGTTPVAPTPTRSSSDISNIGESRLVGFLVSTTTDKNGIFWPLRVGRTRVGSSIDNDIVFVNQEISSSHSVIMVREKADKLKLYLTDENSMNGTLLNGEDIANDKPDLKNGDEITIGPIVMKIFMLDE